MTVHVTIEMNESSKERLDALVEWSGRASGDILVEAAERIAAEDDALNAAVAEARASLESGLGVPHEEVLARVLVRRSARGLKT